MSNLDRGCVIVTPCHRWRACITHVMEGWTLPGTVQHQRRNAGALARSPQGEQPDKRGAALERLAQRRAEGALAKACAINRSSP